MIPHKHAILNVKKDMILRNLPMDVDEILQRYNLTRDTARKYIDAIVQQNQSQAADDAGISRRTVNTYQRAFHDMTDTERATLISALAQENLIDRIDAGD